MLTEKLRDTKLILGSGSPRRQFFLRELGLDFEVRPKDIDENYPEGLKAAQISDYLAVLKAKPFLEEIRENELLITADTIVWLDGTALGKPGSEAEAVAMLKRLSGRSHQVISSVALTAAKRQWLIHDTTEVLFKQLREEEIMYYVKHYAPYDKAGAYGIQEWIGYIGIESIRGSYFNVMGFPVQKFYQLLSDILAE